MRALHPLAASDDTEEDLALIDTRIINTPIPKDYSEDSLAFLENLQNLESDQILMSKAITRILDRKWENHAKMFYLV